MAENFSLGIAKFPAGKKPKYMIGWENNEVPPEIVITMVEAFLEKTKKHYQDGLIGDMG